MYPIAPALCATYSTTAASESSDLGMEACPEKTRLRQLARNAVSFLPMYSERNSSCAPPDLSRTGVTLEPSFRLEAAPLKTSRKSLLDTSADLTLGLAIMMA